MPKIAAPDTQDQSRADAQGAEAMDRSNWVASNIGGAASCLALMLLYGVPWGEFAAAQTPSPPVSTPQILSLAVVGPLTPSSKAFGIAHLQGISLAVDEYNEAHAPKIQLKILDDKADPVTGSSAVKSLANSDVLAILGPANSAVTAAVIDLLQAQHIQIPVISSLSTAT